MGLREGLAAIFLRLLLIVHLLRVSLSMNVYCSVRTVGRVGHGAEYAHDHLPIEEKSLSKCGEDW